MGSRRTTRGDPRRSRWSQGRGPRGMRASKARAGLRAGQTRHRRWNAYGKHLPSGPEVGAVCGKAACTDLSGGREVTRVPTATGGNTLEHPERTGRSRSAMRRLTETVPFFGELSRSSLRALLCPLNLSAHPPIAAKNPSSGELSKPLEAPANALGTPVSRFPPLPPAAISPRAGKGWVGVGGI